ncbi:MAG: ribosome maturation factor RimP [Actinobacteria bacterium]|nr:ribosome maturation factor RimP [Actinomycetota bacterium]
MPVSADAISRAVAPLVSAAGLDLEGVVVRAAGRRSLVRVIVDSDRGVSLDAVASISSAISEALDDAGVMGQTPYTLEVSSPGVDRPLTEPRHWRRARGRLVEVELVERAPIVGRVVSSDDTSVTLDISSKERTVEFADIARAVVQVEFNAVQTEED